MQSVTTFYTFVREFSYSTGAEPLVAMASSVQMPLFPRLSCVLSFCGLKPATGLRVKTSQCLGWF
jgi:hypothetical protein